MHMDAHDYAWKDTYPGVWTAMVEIFGQTLIAYAIEIVEEDGVWQPAKDSEEYEMVQWMWDIYLNAIRHGRVDPVLLNGVPHAVFIV